MPRYVIQSRLGEGAMAAVHKAVDASLGRVVALKLLHPIFETNPRVRQRFLREAAVAASLSHPNVVKLYDAGEDDGKLFLAMELVEGEPLNQILDGRKLPLPRLLDLLESAARGVHHAHEHGIIHRDLKPANILVSARGEAKVGDFGLAHLLEAETTLTQSGALLGTPLFMSPEQARGRTKDLTPPSDVYALGAILNLMLTGRPPHEGDNTAAVIANILGEEIVPPRKRDPSIPAALETICLKALEPDPARRYATAAAFADDLRRHLEHRPIATKPPSTLSAVVRRLKRHRVMTAAAGVLLVAVLIGGVVVVAQRNAAGRQLGQSKALGNLWASITERKRELHSLRTEPGQARGDLAKAVAEADRFLEGGPQGRYLRARGRLYLGDFEGAEADLRAALAAFPDFRPGWSLLGIVKTEACLDALYSDSDPERRRDIEPMLREAGEAFAKGWEPGREREQTERWDLPWTREDDVMQRLAGALRLAYLDGNVDAARSLLELELARYRAEEYALFVAIWTKDLRARLKVLDEAVEWAPGYEWTRFARGAVKYRLGDAAGAVADYDRALAIRPAFVAALNNRGNAKLKLGEAAAAIADYDRALEIRPDFFEAVLNRGNAKLNRGDVDGALEDYDRAVGLRPDSWVATFNRGNARKDRGDAAGAIEDYGRTIERSPSYAPAYFYRGTQRHARGEAAAALEDYDRAIAIDPGYAEAHYNRGNLLFQRGGMREAIASYDRALAVRRDYADALANRGSAKIALGEVTSAVADLDRAIELDKNHAEAYVSRANAKVWREDYAGAVADADRAIELKKMPEAYMNRALARQGLRQYDAALEDYGRAIALRKTDASAYYNRASLRIERGEVQEALADYDRAIELRPDYASALMNRGSVRDQLGQTAAAIADYEQCLKVTPKNWPKRAMVEELLKRAKAK